MTMPPDPAWFQGRDAVGTFIARWVFPQRAPMRLVPVAANRQPGFAVYGPRTDGALQALAIHILRLDRAEVAEISGFVGSAQFSRFGLDASIGLSSARERPLPEGPRGWPFPTP
jgi:RNA polymerase sigma-70 factor (ECF subfamily)